MIIKLIFDCILFEKETDLYMILSNRAANGYKPSKIVIFEAAL